MVPREPPPSAPIAAVKLGRAVPKLVFVDAEVAELADALEDTEEPMVPP